MFKEKSSKKKLNIDTKDVSTLDAMHNKMIKQFENIDKDIGRYKQILVDLEIINGSLMNEIEYCKLIQDKDQLSCLWTSNIEIKERMIDIKSKIQELKSYDEIEYYKNTSDILFQYYDTVEKQSSNLPSLVSQTVPISYAPKIHLHKMHKSDNKKRRIVTNNVNVLDALNNTKPCEPNNAIIHANVTNTASPANSVNSSNSSNSASHVNPANITENIIDKSSLVDKYLSIINKQHVRNVNQDEIEICKVCKSSMTCLQYDAIMICDTCGYQELLLVEQNRPILKQNTKDTSHFSYKRINHFREWCNQVQGKESTDIPDEIFEKILNEIKKEKITDTKTITYNKMRDILKRLRINKYYEHINYIINRINGIPTPQFSPELEEKLCNMFRNIQGPFLKHCPKDRKNFLSYSYVLYKFFQILGLHEYLKYFPLLKSREKLYVQDQIWKKICKELNYEIIPSL